MTASRVRIKANASGWESAASTELKPNESQLSLYLMCTIKIEFLPQNQVCLKKYFKQENHMAGSQSSVATVLYRRSPSPSPSPIPAPIAPPPLRRSESGPFPAPPRLRRQSRHAPPGPEAVPLPLRRSDGVGFVLTGRDASPVAEMTPSQAQLFWEPRPVTPRENRTPLPLTDVSDSESEPGTQPL